VSISRAAVCAERLWDLSAKGTFFFLHETQVQLQLAMFGETEEFMNASNEQFRKKLAGEMIGDVVPFLSEIIERLNDPNRITGCGS
jgi:hypothetical protein